MPFEIERVTVTPDGFNIRFTKPVAPKEASDAASYKVTTFTHNYAQGYGGPEVEQTAPNVKSVKISEDGLTSTIALDAMTKGHVHEFDLRALRDRDGGELLHRHAYYTLNEVPSSN